LDELIDAILLRPETAPPAGSPELAVLAAIAADLRELPGAGFKARLKSDLQRRAQSMTTPISTAAVNPIREGFRTITPYLIVHQGAELIEFVKRAFGAVETFRGSGSAGGMHAEVRVGDSMIMIGG